MTPPTVHRLLIAEPPLQVLPSLAVAFGLNEAIFLQQLHYLLLHKGHWRDGRKWYYNTYPEWQTVFPFWSEPTLRRIIKRLEQQALSGAPRPVLLSTVVDGERSVVNFGGQILAIDEETHGYRLLEVKAFEATFSRNGERIRLDVEASRRTSQ